METNNRNDYFLIFAAYALKKIHRNFFEALKTDKLEKQEGEKEKEPPSEENPSSTSKPRKFNKINLAYQYARTKIFYKNVKFQCFLGEGQN